MSCLVAELDQRQRCAGQGRVGEGKRCRCPDLGGLICPRWVLTRGRTGSERADQVSIHTPWYFSGEGLLTAHCRMHCASKHMQLLPLRLSVLAVALAAGYRQFLPCLSDPTYNCWPVLFAVWSTICHTPIMLCPHTSTETMLPSLAL